MAETSSPSAAMAESNTNPTNSPPGQKRLSNHQIYALPAPVKTFPLPSFYPSNPLSFLQLAYAWLGQVWSPPPKEPSVVHQGIWSAETSSVHIKDEASMRALWQQGFYGKGNLSRSEPNWLKREQVRLGLEKAHVSEIHTVERREERNRAKWERARLEQENIRLTLEKEARRSRRAERRRVLEAALPAAKEEISAEAMAPVGPAEILALPNSATSLPIHKSNGYLNGAPANGIHHSDPTRSNGISESDLESSSDDEAPSSNPVIPGLHLLKQQKSVRFSPTVESTTFDHADPPSPGRSSDSSKQQSPPTQSSPAGPGVLANKEHLQLMPEEALWLSFGLGALSITDPVENNALSNQELLTLFRQYCYFPPRTGPDDPDLQPDDDFLVHYVVYHHFRSLGWVPRAGIKFGVDWLLYAKGPVFDHAEFGLLVIPSYTDPWWQSVGKQGPQKTWQWLHCILRVLSHVIKSMVLVYVDVPPPHKFNEALDQGFAEALKLYKVREMMVKRWSSNRNR